MVDICKNYIVFLKYTETLNLVGSKGSVHADLSSSSSSSGTHGKDSARCVRTVPCAPATLKPGTAAGGFMCWGMNVPRLLLWGKGLLCPGKMGDSRKQETVLWGSGHCVRSEMSENVKAVLAGEAGSRALVLLSPSCCSLSCSDTNWIMEEKDIYFSSKLQMPGELVR